MIYDVLHFKIKFVLTNIFKKYLTLEFNERFELLFYVQRLQKCNAFVIFSLFKIVMSKLETYRGDDALHVIVYPSSICVSVLEFN